jgi:hypothetical protein
MAGRRTAHKNSKKNDPITCFLEDLYQDFENACKAYQSSPQLKFLEWSKAKCEERASDTSLTAKERDLLCNINGRLVKHRQNWLTKRLLAAEQLAQPGTSLDVHFRA